MIVFTDLETTGLDPRKDAVLEIGCIITDDQLTEVARFEQVIHHMWAGECANTDLNDSMLRGMLPLRVDVDEYVINMHRANGLWALSQESGTSPEIADQLLAKFIRDHCPVTGEKTGPQLAGNTISFDRAFLQTRLPVSHGLLHYRNVDVSSFNEIARRFWPEIWESRPRASANHRAMSDVENSLEVMRHYVKTLGPR